MLDLPPLTVTELVEGGETDLFYSPTLKFGQGAVAESGAHVTLLYGLLNLGPLQNVYVDAVLAGWTIPSVRISSVGHFPSSVEDEDYSVIVGHIEITPELLEGRERLQLLPHIDSFPGYKAHVTLAYIKNGESGVQWTDSSREKWVQTLEKHFAGREFTPSQINYGANK